MGKYNEEQAMTSLEKANKRRAELRASGYLRPRQKLFADGILQGLNHLDAARAAGFKDGPNLGKQVARLLKHPPVKKYLDAAYAEAAKRNELSLDEIIQNYRTLIELGVRENKLGDAVKANEGLARILGAFNDSVSVKHSENPFVSNADNDHQLDRLRSIAAARTKLKDGKFEGSA